MEGKETTVKKESFFKRKDIEISVKRYLQDALSAMALGLFGSLLIGVIFQHDRCTDGKSVRRQRDIHVLRRGRSTGEDLYGCGYRRSCGMEPQKSAASTVYECRDRNDGRQHDRLRRRSGRSAAGAFLAVAVGAEFGKMVSKETKVDILVTPAVTLISGAIVAKLMGPAIGWCMLRLGDLIMTATEWQPFVFGIVISVIVGLVLTAPISSAALCIMLDLSGLAAGAATVGCCAQMVGFAVASYKENGVGGLVAQGLGTSMLQVSNIIKNPWILLPATLSGAIIRADFDVRVQDDEHSCRRGNGNIRTRRADRNIQFDGILIRHTVEGTAAPDRAAGGTHDHHRQVHAKDR